MHDLCFFFAQKSFLTKKSFLFAEINLSTRGPLHTCLVLLYFQVSKVNRKIEQSRYYYKLITTIYFQTIKAFVKHSSQYIPILGWTWWFADYPFCKRNWKEDQACIFKTMDILRDYPVPYWVSIFKDKLRTHWWYHDHALIGLGGVVV